MRFVQHVSPTIPPSPMSLEISVLAQPYTLNIHSGQLVGRSGILSSSAATLTCLEQVPSVCKLVTSSWRGTSVYLFRWLIILEKCRLDVSRNLACEKYLEVVHYTFATYQRNLDSESQPPQARFHIGFTHSKSVQLEWDRVYI